MDGLLVRYLNTTCSTTCARVFLTWFAVGVIERCNYDGSAQSRLSNHIAEINFIASRTSVAGVLTGSSDGALVYWQVKPFHVSAFGIAPDCNRFLVNHKVWDCAVDIPSTGM